MAGYKISGLYINQAESNYQGLFGSISGATIKNISVSGSITGKWYVGGIAGYIRESSSIENCYNEGSVYSSYRYVGGIVGYSSSSTVSDCYNEGLVEANDQCVGGIAGDIISSTVERCYNKKSFYNSSRYVGGITGSASGSTISECYNSGSIESTSDNETTVVGGIVGYINKSSGVPTTISNCYNTGSVKAKGNVGGILGSDINEISQEPYVFAVNNSYNIGSVSGELNVGGGVGYSSLSKYAANYCYYDENEVAEVTGAVQGGNENTSYGLSTDMMKSSATTEGSLLYYFTNESYGNSSEWVYDTNNINNGYPVLTWQTSNN